MATNDSIRLYMHELRTIPPVTEEEIKKLYKQMKKGDKEAKKRMIEGNLRLVVSIAKHYSCYGLDFLDLIEEGNLGLMKAIEKYKLGKGHSFSTYAFWWIRQFIQRAILNQTRAIHIPLYAYETIKKLIRVSQELEKELQRQPTESELAKKLHLNIEKTKRFMQEIQVFNKIGSLESPIDDKYELFIKDMVREESSKSPDRVYSVIKLHDEVNKILEKLSVQEMKVIKYRFGLIDGKSYNLREIGETMKLSRERIRQVEKKAISKMKYIILRMNIPEISDIIE